MSDELPVDDAMESTESSVAVQEAPSQPEPSPAPEQPAAPAQQPSVWSAFKAIPDFRGADDRAIAQRLYQSFEREKAATQKLSQYQQLIPYAQEYLKHREPFEQWLQSQSQPAPQQPAQPQQAGWWNPPEVRDSDRQFLVRDANGREVISEEAPLHVRERLYEYQRYKAEFAQKFLANPEEALGPMVEQIAQRKADELIADRLTEQQENQYVSSIEEQNKDWLYDQDGNPTPEGLAISRYINDASELGIASPERKWEYATAMLERDLLQALRQQQASQAQQTAFQQALPPAPAETAPPSQPQVDTNQAQRDIEYLRREASRRPSRSTGAPDPRAPRAPMTFEERLKAQLARDGLV